MERSKLLLALRRIVLFIPVLGISFFQVSCNNEDESLYQEKKVTNTSVYKCATCKTVALARVEFDNSHNGVYYGVSDKGVISVDLRNSSSEVSEAKYQLENKLINFSLLSESLSESSYQAIFSSSNDFEDHLMLRLNVELDGSNPRLVLFNSGIIGRSVILSNSVKERSFDMIEVFSGGMYKERIDLGGDNEGNRLLPINDGGGNPSEGEVVLDQISSERYIVSRANGSWYATSSETYELGPVLIIKYGEIRNNVLYDQNNNEVGRLRGDALEGQKVDDDGARIFFQALRMI